MQFTLSLNTYVHTVSYTHLDVYKRQERERERERERETDRQRDRQTDRD